MTVRDLIPWGRQSHNLPASYRDEENPFWSLNRSVNRLVDDLFRETLGDWGGRGMTGWPHLEVNENDHEVRIAAELPGLEDKDVDLRIEDNVLTLRGEKKSESADKERGYSERYYGRFERRIGLPSNVEADRAKAEFRHGVLTVTLPKSAQAETGRRIPINAETRH